MTTKTDTEHAISGYRAKIEANTEHLTKALAYGDRAEAHRYVDSIIDIQHQIEDLTA